MEELTIEQKAQRYNEALNRARKLEENSNGMILKKWLWNIFPELKESKDERIRKWIIDDIRFNMNNEPLGDSGYKKEAQKAIAWLEKQSGEIDEDLIAKKFLINKGYPIDANGTFPTYEELYNIIREGLEHQGEQKPADKKEPKFQNGQWIVWQKCYRVNYNGCGYELIDQNGLSTSLEYGTVDESAHLWTLQDAKPGDILVGYEEESKSYNSPFIAICKERGLDFFYSYCFIDLKGNFNLGTTVHSSFGIKPATKEQRDTLIKAMADAGWEFDFEKKELKKIIEEVNGEDYGIDGLWHAQTILEKTLGKVDGYQSDDGILEHKAAITAVKKLYEQKPAWSEEDDAYKSFALSAVEDYYDEKNPLRKDLVDWLNSLKQRIGE